METSENSETSWYFFSSFLLPNFRFWVLLQNQKVGREKIWKKFRGFRGFRVFHLARLVIQIPSKMICQKRTCTSKLETGQAESTITNYNDVSTKCIWKGKIKMAIKLHRIKLKCEISTGVTKARRETKKRRKLDLLIQAESC